MSAPRKYDRGFRDRAVRMYRDRLAEAGESKLGARRNVGALLDLNPATLRNWVEDAERADGLRGRPRPAVPIRRRSARSSVGSPSWSGRMRSSRPAPRFAQAELDRQLR